MSQYCEFRKSTIACKDCNWVGLGAEMVQGEAFGDGCDKHGPRCDWRYGFIAYTMSHEFKRAPAQTH
jgi:hypothetical protein